MAIAGDIWTCDVCGAKSKPVEGISEAGRTADNFRILYPACQHGPVIACEMCQHSAACPKCNTYRFMIPGETGRII